MSCLGTTRDDRKLSGAALHPTELHYSSRYYLTYPRVVAKHVAFTELCPFRLRFKIHAQILAERRDLPGNQCELE